MVRLLVAICLGATAHVTAADRPADAPEARLGALRQPESPPTTRFTGELNETSKEGHMTLAWTTDGEGGEHQLEYSQSPDFVEAKLWYQGPAQQSFASGLPEGEHYYRVRSRVSENEPWGPWSDAMHLTVELQSLRNAWILFAIGAVMALCITGFIIWHALRSEPPEAPGTPESEVSA